MHRRISAVCGFIPNVANRYLDFVAEDDGFESTASKFRREGIWHFVKSDNKRMTIKHPDEPE